MRGHDGDMFDDEVRHQIIRQEIWTPMGTAHKIECTCGRQITLTNSLKLSYQRADEHLAAADKTRK